MTEKEFIEYYVRGSKNRELLLENVKPKKCYCGYSECKGWVMEHKDFPFPREILD